MMSLDLRLLRPEGLGASMAMALYSAWSQKPIASALPTFSTRCSRSTRRLWDPLPHQITAVYEAMLPRQPLRFLLADDPGAGKTIMAGLLIKELIARGDLKRCLIVCPGSLAEQWQDELGRRFHLPFEILTNDKFEAARTGNWFLENDLAIARLDKLSRNEDVQQNWPHRTAATISLSATRRTNSRPLFSAARSSTPNGTSWAGSFQALRATSC
jgi:SNF2 family DNA or RNA helicase